MLGIMSRWFSWKNVCANLMISFFFFLFWQQEKKEEDKDKSDKPEDGKN